MFAAIGHNNPPSLVELTRDAMADLSTFLTDNPVIQSEEQAKQGALYVERSRKTLQDLEDARKREVSPLNERVKSINEQYRQVRDPFDNVLSELRRRLTDYTAKEEARRIREAEEKRRAALEAEMEARRAEEAERQAKSNASFGEITYVAEAVVEADQKFSAYKQADRQASIAERETHVRLPSQLGGKALSLKTKETLVLDDAMKAIQSIGVTEGIRDAILAAARSYRKLRGELPPGIRAEQTRSI